MKKSFSIMFMLILVVSAGVLAAYGGSGREITPQINPNQPRSSKHPSQTSLLSGGNVVLSPGGNMVLSGSVAMTTGGDFVNLGTFTAGDFSTVNFDGGGSQTLTGATTFGNLHKSGNGTLTLTSPITVNGALDVFEGHIDVGPNSIAFGPGGIFNGEPAGGNVIGPNVILGPGFRNLTLFVASGWNMVSVPLSVSDYHKSVLYPASISNAFAYNGFYSPMSVLENGVGYWLKFPGTTSVAITGSIVDVESVSVNAGWNMIGCTSYPLQTTAVVPIGTEIQSQFYGYSNGYFSTTTLVPGSGYWVKASQNGSLILRGGGSMVAPSPKVKTQAQSNKSITSEMTTRAMNQLTIKDARGNEQTLYFTRQQEGIDKKLFVLPPLPPDAAFDVRFLPQSSKLEISEPTKDTYSAIRIAGAQSPMTVSWNIPDGSVPTLSGTGKEISMRGRGELTITDMVTSSEEPVIVRLRIPSATEQDLPKDYALDQNYPNPFNPLTVIRYSLPVASQVVLKVYDVLGREVKTLVDEVQTGGYATAQWDASGVASGMYYFRISAQSIADPRLTFTRVKKMVLLR